METKMIPTSIGEIAVRIKAIKGTVPIIFLHGVYFNQSLWNYHAEQISDRTVITLDMPLHGLSKKITKKDWSIDDCAVMLLEILEHLKIDKVIAIGHSWGSMTILRSAVKNPERFESIGLCNMPIHKAKSSTKLKFKIQHLMLGLRTFYIKQVAKALFGKESLAENPKLLDTLNSSMRQLTIEEIIQTDQSVIIEAEDATTFIQSLKIPAFALKGMEDYVAQSNYLNYKLVKGGHVSPLEEPMEVSTFIQKIIESISVD